MKSLSRTIATSLVLALVYGAAAQTLTVYSGRNEAFVDPVVAMFERETGLEVEVRYGDTASLAAQILEEGTASPADVYLAQDAGALGALEAAGLLAALPDDVLDLVEPRFRSDDGRWVGVTGRARVLVVREGVEDVPTSVFDLVDEAYRGRVGWAPTNGSFQSFVTAMRVTHGNERTEEWLRGMIANDARPYANNNAQVEAAARGEIDFGLVNHYYLWRALQERPEAPARNHFQSGGGASSFVNVAGVGVLRESPAAIELVRFLVSDEAQRYFAEETFEYPLVPGVEPPVELEPLESLEPAAVDYAEVAAVLEETLELIRASGLAGP